MITKPDKFYRPWKPCLENKKCDGKCKLPESELLINNEKEKPCNEGRVMKYPINKSNPGLKFFKNFHIKYEGTLSLTTKGLLNCFRKKYIYYAIDDSLNFLNSNSNDQKKLGKFLYSAILSLQNDFSINFFDIWIDSVYVNNITKNNKFLINNSTQVTYITLKLFYVQKTSVRKSESIW